MRGWPRIARMRPARLSVREASELPDVGAETGGERAWGIVNMPLPAGVEPYTAAQRQEAAKLAPAGGSPKLQLGVVHIYRPVGSVALGNDSIYLNNFIDNVDNVYSNDRYANNTWGSPVVRYVYNGTEYTGRLGNYWDDYAGVDADGDGVGEAGYAIDAYNIDQYPLVEPSENYRILL